MRCYICDFSDTGLTSEYKLGLQTQKSSAVGIDKRTGKPICNVCAATINAAAHTYDEEEKEGGQHK